MLYSVGLCESQLSAADINASRPSCAAIKPASWAAVFGLPLCFSGEGLSGTPVLSHFFTSQKNSDAELDLDSVGWTYDFSIRLMPKK